MHISLMTSICQLLFFTFFNFLKIKKQQKSTLSMIIKWSMAILFRNRKKNHHFIELVMITKKKRKSYQKLGLARPLVALWSPSLVSHDGALSVSLSDRCRPHFLVLVIGHFLSLLLESPRSRGYCVFFKNFFTTCY